MKHARQILKEKKMNHIRKWTIMEIQWLWGQKKWSFLNSKKSDSITNRDAEERRKWFVAFSKEKNQEKKAKKTEEINHYHSRDERGKRAMKEKEKNERRNQERRRIPAPFTLSPSSTKSQHLLIKSQHLLRRKRIWTHTYKEGYRLRKDLGATEHGILSKR